MTKHISTNGSATNGSSLELKSYGAEEERCGLEEITRAFFSLTGVKKKKICTAKKFLRFNDNTLVEYYSIKKDKKYLVGIIIDNTFLFDANLVSAKNTTTVVNGNTYKVLTIVELKAMIKERTKKALPNYVSIMESDDTLKIIYQLLGIETRNVCTLEEFKELHTHTQVSYTEFETSGALVFDNCFYFANIEGFSDMKIASIVAKDFSTYKQLSSGEFRALIDYYLYE